MRHPGGMPRRLTERLEFLEVDHERWSDFERLFAARGGPKSCWCMLWRAVGEETARTDGESRRRAMRRRVEAGMPVGILGYLDGEPAVWCSIAPRDTYRALGGVDEPGDSGGAVWSLVCFYVPRRLRGQGITAKLIAAAVAYARSCGAVAVEAYPVAPDSPSYRFMGFVPTFEQAGFREVGRVGTRRHVMRLRLQDERAGVMAARSSQRRHGDRRDGTGG